MPPENIQALKEVKNLLRQLDNMDYFVNLHGDSIVIEASRDLEDEEIQQLERLGGATATLEYNGNFRGTDYIEFKIHHQ